MKSKIPIKEIFRSIDGEVNMYGQGCQTVFIRVAGCDLTCPWCDTPDSRIVNEENYKTLHFVFEEVMAMSCGKVTITGGEPLLYREFLRDLVPLLIRNGQKVTIETNGLHFILPDLECGWVMDFKPPSSGEDAWRFCGNTFSLKRDRDWVKIPIYDKQDLKWAVESTIELIGLTEAGIAWSPIIGGTIEPAILLDTLINNRLDFVKINCQIHKFLKLR